MSTPFSSRSWSVTTSKAMPMRSSQPVRCVSAGRWRRPEPACVVEAEEIRPPGDQRPEVRGVGHARAVAVMIVGRETVIPVVVGIVRTGFPVGDPLAERLVEHAAREVGIDLIGEGRREVADLGLRLADLGPHEEGDDVAVRTAAQLHAVDAAPHVLRDGEAEIVGPAAIVQVVVVEMDGGVMMRRGLPVALRAGPRRALHGPRRQVDQLSVQAVGAGVLDLHRIAAAGEVPGGDAGDRRRLDLAVEAALGRAVLGRLGADQDRRGGVERQRHRRRGVGLALVVGGMGAFQRLLADAQGAGRRIGARPHAIPDARAQRLADHDRARRPLPAPCPLA